MGKNNLEQLRKEIGLDQNETAKLLDMPPSTLCRYEHGEIDMPQSVLEKFADFYRVPIEYITGATDNRHPYSKMDYKDNELARKAAGEYLKTLIRRKGVSLRTLAKRTGVHYTYISRVTSGDFTLTMEKAKAIAEALDLSRDEILNLYDKVAAIHRGLIPADVSDFLASRGKVIELVRHLETVSDPDSTTERLITYMKENSILGEDTEDTFEYTSDDYNSGPNGKDLLR